MVFFLHIEIGHYNQASHKQGPSLQAPTAGVEVTDVECAWLNIPGWLRVQSLSSSRARSQFEAMTNTRLQGRDWPGRGERPTGRPEAAVHRHILYRINAINDC